MMTSPVKLVLVVRRSYPAKQTMFAVHRAGCPDVEKEVLRTEASVYPLSVRPDRRAELVDVVGEQMYGRAYRAEHIVLALSDIEVKQCTGYHSRRAS